ncbi:MAG TPA: L-rhamnose isomerase [Firmicutes bacterium]|nr:L-rhamnose isomerase [Bacillota bacterium]
MQERMELLLSQAEARHIDIAWVKEQLKQQRIETPSWGYADSGTRFKVFAQPGAAVTLSDKLRDAAHVHRMTGIAPSVALHIPWDLVDDWSAVAQEAAALGLTIGAINPNLFQDDAYKMGSLTHPDAKVREKALAHIVECVAVMRATGSRDLSLWLADGINYPGADDLRARRRRLEESLSRIYGLLPPDKRLLIEYKFFEPAFYATDIPDWGMALLLCQKLGDRAKVLVDLGHHAQGVNIEQIVATLLDEGRLGGFHFNNRKYADDDLTTGSINPYELFLIYCELVSGELDPQVEYDVAFMIDQSHNVKPKVEAMIQSVIAIQRAYAKSLLVDRKTLVEAQKVGDIIAAEECLAAAFNTDVEPLLAQVRMEMGVPTDPLLAHRQSGYQQQIETARAGKRGASSLG